MVLKIDVFFFFFKQKTAYEMLRSLVGSEMCIRDRFNTMASEQSEFAICQRGMGFTVRCAKCDHPIFMALPVNTGYEWKGRTAATVLCCPPNLNGFEDHGHLLADREKIDFSNLSPFTGGAGVVQPCSCRECGEDLGCRILEGGFEPELGLFCLADASIRPEYAYIIKAVEQKAMDDRVPL
eukprot:TRINITY_DN1346_c0_g1_i1.p1 TRINITY_DN1346_c0_g1~~TRINITY_DN1346_c0_g1_i1.p1  ORF type:complete len:181 (+),score=57.13 TRINITY_DN1346_c0_g1_i1:39-581(+)